MKASTKDISLSVIAIPFILVALGCFYVAFLIRRTTTDNYSYSQFVDYLVGVSL